jgi:hypothetical protein
MVTHNLKIDLEPREDKDENIYYLGRLKFPGRICLSEGVTFLVFLSEDGNEELQLAINDKEHTTFSKYSRRADRLKVSIESRPDQFGKTFYVAKIRVNGYLDCSKEEVVFLVFNSKQGFEELQVVGDIKSLSETEKDSRIIRRRVIDTNLQ